MVDRHAHVDRRPTQYGDRGDRLNSSARRGRGSYHGSSRPVQNQLTCHFCNNVGHDVRICRKLQRFLREHQVPHPASPTVHHTTTTPSTSTQPWLFDSGASHHVTSDASLLPSYTDYGGPDEIRLGDGNCGLCGDEGESLTHIFLTCSVAKEAWEAISWSWTGNGASNFMEQVQLEFQARRRQELEKLIEGCWALWCERNQRLWQNSFSSAGQFMVKAQTYVLGWSQAQLTRRNGKKDNYPAALSWRRPAGGRLKLNVDDAVWADKCGFGWCLRDANGNFVAGAVKPWLRRLFPLDAELIGIREALSWLQGTDQRTVDVESDAARVIS